MRSTWLVHWLQNSKDVAPNQQQLALMDPGEAAATAVAVLAKATVNTAKAHPKITGSWALGLVLVAFATGFKVTEQQHQAYDAGMQAADMSAPIGAVAERLRDAEARRYQASGFFSCDTRCQYWKDKAAVARREDEIAAARRVAKVARAE